MTTSSAADALARLHDIIDQLIGPDGCPWDKEQTPSSLTEYLIEECFELVDAIRSGDVSDTRDEMGDLLFLVVFIARLHQRGGTFSLADAFDATTAKMIRRHPHVFEDTQVADREALLANWEQIKREEQARRAAAEHEATGREAPPKGILDGVPRNLPPLTKAYRVHAKAAANGFTWPDDEEVERQVEAEWLELLDASVQGNEAAIEHEFGDHLFSLVELGRRKGIKAAAALDAATNRFVERFGAMEALARARGLDFIALSLDEKDELWEAVKRGESA